MLPNPCLLCLHLGRQTRKLGRCPNLVRSKYPKPYQQQQDKEKWTDKLERSQAALLDTQFNSYPKLLHIDNRIRHWLKVLVKVSFMPNSSYLQIWHREARTLNLGKWSTQVNSTLNRSCLPRWLAGTRIKKPGKQCIQVNSTLSSNYHPRWQGKSQTWNQGK